MKPTAPPPATITAEQLAGLAGTTRQQILALADEKIIPAAVAGRFPMLESITALFRYYQRATADHFPTLDSMQSAAAVLGVPLSLMKRAKAQGCSAFKLGSRVDTKILIPYLFEKILSDAKRPLLDPAQEKAKLDAARRRALERQEKIDTGEMMRLPGVEDTVWHNTLAPLRAELLQLARLCAAQCNPDNPATAQAVLDNYVAGVLKKINDANQQLIPENETKTPHS
jgi:hypothetical protein